MISLNFRGLRWSFRLGIFPLQQPHLGIFGESSKSDSTVCRRSQAVCPSFLCNILVAATRIDAQDASNVVTITRYTKLAESVAPLVQKGSHGLADLVFAVLGMVAGTADGIDGPAGSPVVEKTCSEVGYSFFWMQACGTLAECP